MWSSRDREESLGEIVSRVVDSGKDYVRAEIALVKAEARSKVAAIRPAAILIVCALFLVQAGLTVLAAALGMALAHWIGPAGGLAVAALIVLAAAGILVAIAISGLRKAFG